MYIYVNLIYVSDVREQGYVRGYINLNVMRLPQFISNELNYNMA